MINLLDITENPIQHMGKMAGVCYGTNTQDPIKNYKRGLDVLKANHGRVLEFPEVTLELTGYSNRVIRELYTHIIGVTRLQESTRYVSMRDKFTHYYTPQSIQNNEKALDIYSYTMETLSNAYQSLIELGISKEDAGNLVPLGQHTKIVLKVNLRALINMFEVRTCDRAYIEYRILMGDIKSTLTNLDQEWDEIMSEYAITKCDKTGYCTENSSCGRYPLTFLP